jgi:hypothetical protein
MSATTDSNTPPDDCIKKSRANAPIIIKSGVPPRAASSKKTIKGTLKCHATLVNISQMPKITSGCSKPHISLAITGKDAIVPNTRENTGNKNFQPVSPVLRAKRIAITPNATGIIKPRILTGIKPILPSSAITLKEMELHAITIETKAEIRLHKIFNFTLI